MQITRQPRTLIITNDQIVVSCDRSVSGELLPSRMADA
jgi:hypothetical protein